MFLKCAPSGRGVRRPSQTLRRGRTTRSASPLCITRMDPSTVLRSLASRRARLQSCWRRAWRRSVLWYLVLMKLTSHTFAKYLRPAREDCDGSEDLSLVGPLWRGLSVSKFERVVDATEPEMCDTTSVFFTTEGGMGVVRSCSLHHGFFSAMTRAAFD
ncbi:hypothetical protein NDU88_000195 [Pleurodeles waltl]|uniref:Uncharacterized protein n=1 Tax=Pleurodeles waltl TaxID=8319 RepID=A0AAV7U3N4_PLEWA|nr:hypothetical protein NDU88_000195 [Pleurodeles waltl]